MGNDSIIYIRTDGNSAIATGHLVRCLAVTEALEALGKKVCFLLSDSESEGLLLHLAKTLFSHTSFSFTYNILDTASYNAPETELIELENFFSLRSHAGKTASSLSPCCTPQASIPDKPILLLDSYYVTYNYLQTLNRFVKVAYIDDLRSFDYPVELLINYDIIPPSQKEEYLASYTQASIKLLGGEYAPLRRQFQKQDILLRRNVEHILITTGGSDPYAFTTDLISYLLSANLSATFHVVVGALFTNQKALEELEKRHSCLKLHPQVSDMAALMKQCDFAISAAGTTLYELCALGIPSVSFSMANNQIPMAETFARVNAIPYAGDIRDLQAFPPLSSPPAAGKEKVLSFLLTNLKASMKSPQKRAKSSRIMHQLVAGDGAIKIAKALCRL